MVSPAGLPEVAECALRRVSDVRRGVRVRVPRQPLRSVGGESPSSMACNDQAGELQGSAVVVPRRRPVTYPAGGEPRRTGRSRFRRLPVRLIPGGPDKPSRRVRGKSCSVAQGIVEAARIASRRRRRRRVVPRIQFVEVAERALRGVSHARGDVLVRIPLKPLRRVGRLDPGPVTHSVVQAGYLRDAAVVVPRRRPVTYPAVGESLRTRRRRLRRVSVRLGGRTRRHPGVVHRVRDRIFAVAQGAVEASRRCPCRRGWTRQPDRGVRARKMAEGAHGRVRLVGGHVDIGIPRAPLRRVGRLDPGPVTHSVVQAGYLYETAQEVFPVADPAGDEAGTARLPLRGRPVALGRSRREHHPAGLRPVMACGGEAGGVRDPPLQIIPMTGRALRDR